MKKICSKKGFSTDRKHSNPQIYFGILVGFSRYAIGYEIFEGDIYEGHCLIPVIEKLSLKYELNKPIIVADAKSKDNIEAWGYEYIIGERIKNGQKEFIYQIKSDKLKNAEFTTIKIKKIDTLYNTQIIVQKKIHITDKVD